MPHPGQRYVREHRGRFTWLAAGRRWRKTTLCVSLMVEAALDGQTVIWGAPTYDQVYTAWEETRKACRGVVRFNQSRMVATLGRGAMLFRSLDDPDNARSKTADGIIIDEIADVAEEAWTEVLRPMLMDTGGWLIGSGTPKGRNWFWREWKAAQRGDRVDGVAFQAPTLGAKITLDGLERSPHPLENPQISFDELSHLYATMPERSFRQEILAEFIEDSGGVFRRVREAAIAAQRTHPEDGHTYVVGADWGKSNDYTVFVVLDAGTHQVVTMDRSNHVDYEIQRGRLMALCERWRPAVVVAESNAMGVPIIEALSRERVPVRPFQTTNATKSVAIDALSLAFERGDIQIIPNETLIDELQAYEMERLPSGLMRYGAPSGLHDDCVMALALAWTMVGRTSSAVGAFG